MAKATVSEKIKAARHPEKKTAAASAAAGKATTANTSPSKQTPRPKRAATKAKVAPVKKAVGKKAVVKQAAGRKAVAGIAGPKKALAGKAASGKKAPAENVAARARTVTVKKVAPRRAASRTSAPTPTARRARPTASRTPPGKLNSPPPQTFTVNHLNEADFKADGLRAYAHYRDLGIAGATGGLCQAHVIRLIPPCTDEVRQRHLHKTELQLVYVLKGWMKNEFDGHGEQMMSVGSCWLQPSGIAHTVLDYSPDCEVLEIIVPADFKTENAT